MGRDHVAHDAVRLVELPNLAEWAVGDEVHRILAVLHRDIEREPTEAVGGIDREQATPAVRFDLPAWSESPLEGNVTEERGTKERRVGDREAPQGPGPWTARNSVADPNL